MKHVTRNRRLGVCTLQRALAAAVMVGCTLVAGATSQIGPDRTILQIGTYADLGYIVFSPAVPNLEGCSYTTGDQVAIDWSTNANNKSIYATAVAAYLAGQKAGFGISGCHAGGLPLLYRIDVKP